MESQVHFLNNRQQKLAGILELPTHKGPFPAVILVHGFAATKDMFFFPQLAKALVNAGFAVLRFDARGRGESEGDIHPTYLTLAADIESAVSFLSSRKDIGALGLAGHSMGGTSCILVAKNNARVQAVVTFGAVADTESSVKEKFSTVIQHEGLFDIPTKFGLVTVDHSFFDDAKEVHLINEVKTLNKPLLLIHGTHDTRVHIEQGTQLFLRASLPKSFKKISECDHWFIGHESTLIESTTDFLTHWLTEKRD